MDDNQHIIHGWGTIGPIFVFAQIVIIGLKIFEKISFPWFYVFAPIWMPYLAAIVSTVGYIIIEPGVESFKRRYAELHEKEKDE